MANKTAQEIKEDIKDLPWPENILEFLYQRRDRLCRTELSIK
jgi:hypothetical protein